jgi:hypothetical protein
VGLFGKGTGPAGPSRTVIGPLDENALRVASDLMVRFGRAVGNDAALRQVCAAIHAAAGIRDFKDLLMRSEHDLDIAWRWLEAAASGAAQRGDNVLPSQVFTCSLFWNSTIAPHLQMGDMADLCLPEASAEMEASLAMIALPCLLALPGATVVSGNDTGELTAKTLGLVAANQITRSAEAGVSVRPDIAALAADVVNGRAAYAEANSASSIPDPEGDLFGKANAQMDRVKSALGKLALTYHDMGVVVVGVGVCVPFGEEGFTALSVSGGGSEGLLHLTSGVLKNVRQDDKLRILEMCNAETSNNSTFPTYLHAANAGWDILVQQRIWANMLLNDGDAFKAFIQMMPQVAKERRDKFIAAGVVGESYAWNEDDLHRLVARSML